MQALSPQWNSIISIKGVIMRISYIVEVNLISETDIFPGTGSCPAYEDVFGGYMKGKL